MMYEDQGKEVGNKNSYSKGQLENSFYAGKVSVLVIRRSKADPEDYIFWIESPQAVITEHEFRIPKNTQDRIRQQLDLEVNRISGVGTSRDQVPFESQGRRMYALLLPPDLQEALFEINTPLVISTNDPTLPWELLHNGEGFLGVRLSIGRRLMGPWKVGLRLPLSDKPLSFLLIANPTGDLPDAEAEIQDLLTLLPKNSYKILCRERATWDKVQEELSKGIYDVIHYSGHAGFDVQTQEGCLIFAEGKILLATEIARTLRGFPLVFLNGCYTSPIQHLSVAPQGTENLASAFIIGNKRGRARGFIGTLWRVADAGAREFSLYFYQGLLQGGMLGETLRQAKQAIYQKRSNDATWSSFVLYGDPCLSIKPEVGRKSPSETTVEQGEISTLVEASDGASDSLEGTPESSGSSAQSIVGDDWLLNINRLGDSALVVLYYAWHEMISMLDSTMFTPHLFIALTKIQDGFTQRFLKEYGFDPKEVRDLIRTDFGISNEGRTGLPDGIGAFSISSHLKSILQLAEIYAKLDKPGYTLPLIEEKHLVQSFFEDGEGIAIDILKQLGVNLPEGREAILSMSLFSEPLDSKKDSSPQKESSEKIKQKELPLVEEDRRYSFSESANLALSIAFAEARYSRHDVVTTPHLFIGLTKIEGGCTQTVLNHFNMSPKRVRDALRYVLGVGKAPLNSEITTTKRIARILQIAREEAKEKKVSVPTIEEKHLLIAVLMDGEGLTIEVLKRFKLDPSEMLPLLQSGRDFVKATSAVKSTLMLDALGRNLTKLAKDGKLSPVIGREEEIKRLVLVLSRKTKNNPVLIGEAGVGKTAIVEGLAQRIADNQIQSALQNKHIVDLSVASLVAGTKYRGEFEERLQKIVEEAEQVDDIILFMDEIHTLIGAGAHGTLDAANILKPALARGKIHCIGATTIDEYRRYMEKDAAFERRFQPIVVNEPSPSEALAMLTGAKAGFETHHQVNIQDEALAAAVELSVAHLPDRYLPDKAFDLIDEACAQVGIVRESLSKKQGITGKRGKVRAENVAAVVTMWTGIPLNKLKKEEREHILHLEDRLREHIVGQDSAIKAVAQAVRLARSGLKEIKKPIGVFLFLGPTGVGKTALAKALAKVLFDSEEKMIHIDMSEFMEKHNVAKLIGAPPGYVGYGEEGMLTGGLRTNPYTVVLLDEIEKAHPDVFSLFLQLFDEGKLNDAKGRTVDARNVIFIITSNIGVDLLTEQKIVGFANAQVTDPKSKILSLLRQNFNPEFLNRIDEVVMFNPLSEEDIRAIADILLKELKQKLAAKHNITLQIEENAFELLCREGYDEVFGARPLKRAIEQMIAKPLVDMILKGEWNAAENVALIQVMEGNLIITPVTQRDKKK